MSKRYITTAIPYMNGSPHVGHALDYCLADVCARYFCLRGDTVKLQAGTDEHGNKIFRKAEELGVPVEEYVAKNTAEFKSLVEKLDVSYTDFIRTTDSGHQKRVQEIWQKLEQYIYPDRYEGWYCSGCERYVTDQEYKENHGECPDHAKPYEKLAEENYYFKLTEFKDRIREAITSDKMRILPEFRKKEILKLLDNSPDVSVSRPRSQLTWGVPVPGDDNQVMYVWIDALSNYLTVLGYPDKDISDWWPPVAQFVGKDILRFHAIIWPAMLMGLGLELPKTIISHGMILVNNQKMSKSIGNVVDPIEVLDKYGAEPFRYYFLRHIDTFDDSDFTWEKYESAYNNELANDLGNLVQRLATLISKNVVKITTDVESDLDSEYIALMDNYKYSEAFNLVWSKVQEINKDIDNEKPWMLAKGGKQAELNECLNNLAKKLLAANRMLSPFLPETSNKIKEIFSGEVKPPETPLFPKV